MMVAYSSRFQLDVGQTDLSILIRSDYVVYDVALGILASAPKGNAQVIW